MRGILTILAFTLGATTAFSEDKIQTSDELAQTAAYFIIIKDTCSKWFEVDQDLLKKGSLNVITKGISLFGNDYFQEKMFAQSIVIMKKYNKSGPKYWCSEERGLTKQMGFSFFK